jgi:HSP20 family protein
MSADPRHSEGPLRSSAERFREELDRWMEAAWSQGERAMDVMGIRGRMAGPAVDIIERPDAVVIVAEVPGLTPEQLDVTLAGNLLSIQGTYPAPILTVDETLQRQERPQGAFKRTIPLPACVDPETIHAESRLGVLRVTINKAERDKARRVPIRSLEPMPTTPSSQSPTV